MSINRGNRNYPEIDVLIVGAGISGLTASFKILRKEPTLKVLLVEAEKSVGGQVKKGADARISGKWISENHYHIAKLCKVLNVEVKKRYIVRPDLKPCWEINNCNFFVRLELKRFINEIDVKSKLYRQGMYKRGKNDNTMEKYLCSKLFFENSRTFIRFFVKLLTGAHPQVIRTSDFMAICYTLGAEDYVSEVDVNDLIWNLKESINFILTRTKIVEIIHYTDYVIARDENDNVFHTSMLILALPWVDSMKIKTHPPLPPELQMPVPPNHRYLCTSFLATYIDGYWRKKGFSGSYLCHSLHIIGSELTPTMFSGFILHESNTYNTSKTLVLNALAQCYGEEMLRPREWAEDTYAIDVLSTPPVTAPLNRIILASHIAATLFRGQISGAVQSGLRAALLALLTLRPQSVQWQDIQEIQKAEAVYEHTTYLQLFMCSVNVYNTVYYFTIATVLITIFKMRQKLLPFIFWSK